MKCVLSDGTTYPSIPSLCLCGCNTIVYGGKKFVHGHQTRGIYHPKYGIRGTHLSESTIKKIIISTSGDKNHFFGKHHSEEQKQKWSQIRKGIKPSDSATKVNTERMKIHNPMKNPEIAKRLGESISGENHPNWQGGLSFELYPQEFNKHLREYVRTRDNHTCQLCNKSQEEQLREINKILTIHHIDYDKKNNNINNLISLCVSCNSRVNYRREHYINTFSNKINDINTKSKEGKE